MTIEMEHDDRLQIVNAKNLADIGSPDAIGETFYGGVKREMFITDFYPPGSIMLHEFIHAAYGDDTHCRWASKYLSVLHATDEVGAFTDQCEHVYCDEAAGECWPN